MTHLKRPWCWERLKLGGEGDNRGWDGWMASPTQLAWVWVNSRSWWWTGRPACCSPWSRKESDMTERLNGTEHSVSCLEILFQPTPGPWQLTRQHSPFVSWNFILRRHFHIVNGYNIATIYSCWGFFTISNFLLFTWKCFPISIVKSSGNGLWSIFNFF